MESISIVMDELGLYSYELCLQSTSDRWYQLVSDGGSDRVAYLLEVVGTRVQLCTHGDEPLDCLHPLPAQLIVEHMTHFGGVAFDRDAQHGDAQGPGGFANRQIHVLVVGLDVLPHQAAVHDVVHRPDHLLVPSPALQHLHEALHIRIGVLVAGPALLVPLPQLLSAVLLVECAGPVPEDLVEPEHDLVADGFEGDLALLSNDHVPLLLDVLGVVAEAGLDHPVAVLGVELVELLLLLESELELLVVGLHVEGGVLLVEGFDLEQPVVAFGGGLPEEGDGLVEFSQFEFDLVVGEGDGGGLLLVGFDLLPAHVVLVEVFEFLGLLLAVLHVPLALLGLLQLEALLLLLDDLLLLDHLARRLGLEQ